MLRKVSCFTCLHLKSKIVSFFPIFVCEPFTNSMIGNLAMLKNRISANRLTYQYILFALKYIPEAHSEPCQISNMECFAKIFKVFQSLTLFAKFSILDAWQCSEYVSVLRNFTMVSTAVHVQCKFERLANVSQVKLSVVPIQLKQQWNPNLKIPAGDFIVLSKYKC